MTTREQAEHRHSEVSLAGFRAHAAAIGLVHLLRELRIAGVLSASAVERIRDAVVDELMLSRPLHAQEEDFRNRLRVRFERLMGEPPTAGSEQSSS